MAEVGITSFDGDPLAPALDSMSPTAIRRKKAAKKKAAVLKKTEFSQVRLDDKGGRQCINALIHAFDDAKNKARLHEAENGITDDMTQTEVTKHVMLNYMPVVQDIGSKAVVPFGFKEDKHHNGEGLDNALKQLQELALTDDIIQFQLYALKERFIPPRALAPQIDDEVIEEEEEDGETSEGRPGSEGRRSRRESRAQSGSRRGSSRGGSRGSSRGRRGSSRERRPSSQERRGSSRGSSRASIRSPGPPKGRKSPDGRKSPLMSPPATPTGGGSRGSATGRSLSSRRSPSP